MKLSIKRKRHAVHVRGGRFRRVLLPHAVSCKGASLAEKDHLHDSDGSKNESASRMAKPDDLVLEVYGIKAKRVLGYSYISGAAATLIGYTAKDEWFGEATALAIDMHSPGTVEGESGEDYAKNLINQLFAARYKFDVGVFEHKLLNGEGSLEVIVKIIGEWTRLIPKDHDDTIEPHGHILGILDAARKKDGGAYLHIQPPIQKQEVAASMFAHDLAVTSTHLVKLADCEPQAEVEDGQH